MGDPGRNLPSSSAAGSCAWMERVASTHRACDATGENPRGDSTPVSVVDTVLQEVELKLGSVRGHDQEAVAAAEGNHLGFGSAIQEPRAAGACLDESHHDALGSGTTQPNSQCVAIGATGWDQFDICHGVVEQAGYQWCQVMFILRASSLS